MSAESVDLRPYQKLEDLFNSLKSSEDDAGLEFEYRKIELTNDRTVIRVMTVSPNEYGVKSKELSFLIDKEGLKEISIPYTSLRIGHSLGIPITNLRGIRVKRDDLLGVNLQNTFAQAGEYLILWLEDTIKKGRFTPPEISIRATSDWWK